MWALLTLLLMLFVAPAWADEPPTPMMLDVHELADDARLDAGTVAVSVGSSTLFASAEAGHLVKSSAGRLDVTVVPGHPLQSHHQSAESFSLGEAGALVILVDDRRRLKLVRFDTATASWLPIERPIGFVPRGAAVVGTDVVFPQSARSPAWFVYSAAQNAFRRVARPDGVAACQGVTFAARQSAIVAGTDATGGPCAVSFAPKSGKFAALTAPPSTPGARAVVRGDTAYLLGPNLPTLSYDTKHGKWSTLPAIATLEPGDRLFATRQAIGVWRLEKGELRVATLGVVAKTWQLSRESMDLSSRVVADEPNGHWWVAGRRAGRPVLVDLWYAPEASSADRAASRASMHPQAAEPRDWKTATESDKRKAIEQGLGAVERYVPPELDPKTGKVVTKGAWVFALGEELVVWPVPPKKCERFIEKMIARWPTEVVGSTWKTERGEGFARASKKLLYGPGAQCAATQKCPSDYFSQRVTPLSQVGPIFSYAVHTSAAIDCADPVSTERWVAIDLRTGEPAALTAVIDADAILSALKKHKKLGATVGDSTTLDEAIAKLRAIDGLGLRGYAFGAWRSATRRVELRLEFHPRAPDTVRAIKIWVAPRAEHVEAFEAAARTPGLFMSTSK